MGKHPWAGAVILLALVGWIGLSAPADGASKAVIRRQNEARLAAEVDSGSNGESAAPASDEKSGRGNATSDPVRAEPPTGPVVDPAVLKSFNQSQIAYYEYNKKALTYRTRLFEAQYWESWVIFVVVLMLVTVGVYFSWLQFTDSRIHLLKTPTRTSRAGEEQDPGTPLAAHLPQVVQSPSGATDEANRLVDQPTILEANLKGIKLTSPLLGVVILIISFLFFYLYLVYVYPITNTF